MNRTFLIIILASLGGAACVGDSSTTPDSGSDAGAADVKVDSPPGTCVFGTSHFGDGCKFGP